MRLQIVNIDVDVGLPTFNLNEKSVIFRPFQRIIKKGRETGYISYIFLNTHAKSLTCSKNEVDNIGDFLLSEEFQARIPPEDIKVLGCICYTKGKKILFYPSYATSYLTKFKDRDKPERHEENISIDHFSLEPSFEKWHITHSKGHFKGLKTLKIDGNIINWFGLSINSEVELEQAYRNNPFNYLCRVSDAERRIQDIASSLKYRDDCLITAPIIDEYSNKDSFYHFEFYIKIDSSIPSKEPGILAIPNQRDLQIPVSEKMKTIIYEIDIHNFKGKLKIVATKMAGKLKDNVLIRSC